jgi:alcohol dehydrogenase
VAAALNRLGGARAVLAALTSVEAMTSAIDGLAVRARFIVVGVDAKPIQVSTLQLIGASSSIVGTRRQFRSTRRTRSHSVRRRASVR